MRAADQEAEEDCVYYDYYFYNGVGLDGQFCGLATLASSWSVW